MVNGLFALIKDQALLFNETKMNSFGRLLITGSGFWVNFGRKHDH